ncbi:MAG: peptidylprolyl isomerase [Magnetococcales bacterium]|nr:peptidylprolyl isomerase [Magnetococcales bacterium]
MHGTKQQRPGNPLVRKLGAQATVGGVFVVILLSFVFLPYLGSSAPAGDKREADPGRVSSQKAGVEKKGAHRSSTSLAVDSKLHAVPVGSVDRIAAIVEAQIVSDQPVRPQVITQSEVDDLIQPTIEKMRRSGEEFQLETLRKRGLEELIVRRLRDQKAAQMGVTVTDADVDEIIGQVERKNNLPAGGLAEALRHDGVDYDRYRAQLTDQIMESRLMKRAIMPLLTVTDDELRLLYDQLAQDKNREEEVHLGHIMLEVPSGASYDAMDRVKDKVKALMQSLREGKSFSALASQYSIDPSGLSGGDMGWIKKADLPENLQEVIMSLKTGDISPPVRSPQGLHIFKMIDRRVNETAPDPKSTGYRYRARHILIKVDGDHDEKNALAKIKGILEKIQGGASFEQVAKDSSEDDSNARDGGDLGWMETGTMLEAFSKAIRSLKKGQVSQPVRSQLGWHLIKLEDKESLDPGSFEAQKPALEQRLLATKAKDRYQQWLRDLRLRAYVEFP